MPTLEQLDGIVWPDPDYESYLVTTIHRQWTIRAKEAWRQYGARSDSRSVSDRQEREMVAMAEEFITARSE